MLFIIKFVFDAITIISLQFQVWDVTRSQVFVGMREHERRVWSVDFSIVDPTKLVSGSDDGSVKLWDMNQAILFLHLLYVSFLTNDNMVIELVCGCRVASLHCYNTFFVNCAGWEYWHY